MAPTMLKIFATMLLVSTVIFAVTYFGRITINSSITPSSIKTEKHSSSEPETHFILWEAERHLTGYKPPYYLKQKDLQSAERETYNKSLLQVLNCTQEKGEADNMQKVVFSNTLPCMPTGSCPNIVYLLVDDVGYGDVEYNGGRAHTPNLNAMASGPHSIQFSRFYSGGPTCSPTRGTLLTGRNHNRYCIWHADLGNPKNELTCPSSMPLPSSELTVAEILRDSGYHTAIYGKWHVGDLKPIAGGNHLWPVANPSTHGFMDWLVTERHSSSLLPNCKCSESFSCSMNGTQYSPVRCRNYWYVNPLTKQLTKSSEQVFEDSHFLVDRFEEFLKKRDKSKPFYTQLSFHSVHSQYLATPYWNEYYKYVTNRDHRHYLGTISALDDAIGRVRSLLEKYGIANNTLVIFSSDNGPQKGEPGSTGGLSGRKGTIWEGGIRVPGIIEWPAVICGNRKSSVPVVTSDFLPTVADIIGFKVPEDITLDGISILPILKNEADQRESNIKFAFHIKQGNPDAPFYGAVVGDRYKYYAHFVNATIQQSCLFDLETDCAETRDVSSSHVNITLSMKAELEQFISSVHESAASIGCQKTHDRRHVKDCGNV